MESGEDANDSGRSERRMYVCMQTSILINYLVAHYIHFIYLNNVE